MAGEGTCRHQLINLVFLYGSCDDNTFRQLLEVSISDGLVDCYLMVMVVVVVIVVVVVVGEGGRGGGEGRGVG